MSLQKVKIYPVLPITFIEYDGKYYPIKKEEGTKGDGYKEFIEADGEKLYLNKNRKVAARQPGVYAQTETLESFEDVGRILHYFLEKKKYNYYLLFVLGCNTARRVGDLLKLKWRDFYEKDGSMRQYRRGTEEKTGKNSRVWISKSIAEALEFYVKTENIDVKEEYDRPVFMQRHGAYKGKVLSYKAYWKTLKKAGEELKLECNIGAHTPRRTFGYMAKQLHPNDPLATNITMEFFGHSSERITNRYIGATNQRKKQYTEDFDDAFRTYAVQREAAPGAAKKPVVTIDSEDLRAAIALAYECGMKHAEEDSGEKLEDFTEILDMVDGVVK